MRKLRVLFAWILPVAMLATLPAVAGNTIANADPIPATNWAPVSLSNIPGASTVVTDANGGVTVGCPQANTSTLFESFAADGSVVQNQDVPSGYGGSFCTGPSTVGKDGTVYVAVDTGGTHYVQAWKNNTMTWSYTIPCGGAPWAMTMGANDNLYMVTAWGSSPCYAYQLIGLTPTAQPGTTMPQTVMNRPIYAGSVYGQGLAAYDDGLVMYTSGGIQYAPYTGTWPDVITPSGAILTTQVGLVDRWFEATPSGRVFMIGKADSAQVLSCTGQNSRAGSIIAVDANGSTTSTPIGGNGACLTVHEVHPMPSGGALLRYAYSDSSTGWTDQERISAGSWQQTIGVQDWPGEVVTSVDLNGDIVVRVNAAVSHQVNGSTYRFPQVAVSVFSGFTGEAISGAQFILRGDSTTTSGPSYMWANGGELALAKNTVYVAAYQCTTLGSCNMNATKLYAFTVPGVQTDYPRGAILKHDEPWKNYVAMGDSFSSGQGVPPYENGTATAGPPENWCRRSPGAYAHLLAATPGLQLNLTAFVACGGSETGHVINGRYGELPQLNSLSASTDVVTITIGGNDIGFTDLAHECLMNGPTANCGYSSEYAYTRDQLDNHLITKLTTLYDDIVARVGSSTRVLVVGYPMLIPDPAINTLPNCPLLSHDDKVTAQAVIGDLNQDIQDVVAAAGSQFEYVDPNTLDSPFKGHELCMEGGYFNGVDLANQDESLHPNQLGQEAYSSIMTRYLTIHP